MQQAVIQSSSVPRLVPGQLRVIKVDTERTKRTVMFWVWAVWSEPSSSDRRFMCAYSDVNSAVTPGLQFVPCRGPSDEDSYLEWETEILTTSGTSLQVFIP